jgi:hypothetical protein
LLQLGNGMVYHGGLLLLHLPLLLLLHLLSRLPRLHLLLPRLQLRTFLPEIL